MLVLALKRWKGLLEQMARRQRAQHGGALAGSSGGGRRKEARAGCDHGDAVTVAAAMDIATCHVHTSSYVVRGLLGLLFFEYRSAKRIEISICGVLAGVHILTLTACFCMGSTLYTFLQCTQCGASLLQIRCITLRLHLWTPPFTTLQCTAVRFDTHDGLWANCNCCIRSCVIE
jgi:hypothetical protein